MQSDEPPNATEAKVSEFKEIGGQRTFVTRKPHTLPLPALDGGRSPEVGKPKRRQRTILSELLGPKDARKVRSYLGGPTRELDWVPPAAVAQTNGQELPSMRPSQPIRRRSSGHVTVGQSTLGLPETPRKQTIQLRPKVIDSYVHASGTRPRKVLVERVRQRHLSEDLVEILKSRHGISFENGNVDEGAWLPLELFDNTEYDERAPEEWIGLGYFEAQRQKQHFAAEGEDTSGLPSFLGLEALGLCTEGKAGKWRECCVNIYDSTTGKFGVTFRGAQDCCVWLSKLRVMFIGAESPSKHARRIADAVNLRRMVEAKIRYTVCLDCMPRDKQQGLGGDQVGRILRRVTGKGRRRSSADEERLNRIVDNVNNDVAKAVNRMTMQLVLADSMTVKDDAEDQSAAVIALKHLIDRLGVTLPRMKRRLRLDGFGGTWSRPAPESGLAAGIEPGCFDRAFGKFTFETIYTQRAVIRTVVGVRRLCLELLKSHPTVQLLPINLPHKPCKIEAFKQWQKEAIDKTAARVAEDFTARIVKMIRGNFEGIGKGWFNIEETNLEAYNYGKLKKVIMLVRLMLQDCLRDLAINTAELYVEYMKRHVPDEIKIENLRTVINKWPEGSTQGGLGDKAPEPLFAIEIKRVEKKKEERRSSAVHATNRLLRKRSSGEVSNRAVALHNRRSSAQVAEYEFVYGTNPALYVQTVAGETILTALRAISDVPHVENATVPQLFKAVVYKQKLTTPSLDEEFVVKAKEQLEEQLSSTVLKGLEEYIALLAPYREFLQVDPAKFVTTKLDDEETPATTEEIEADIFSRYALHDKVLDDIPDCGVQIGWIEVRLGEIRKILADKHIQIAKLEIDLLLRRYRSACEFITSECQGITTVLRKTATSVEHLAELRDYAQSQLPSLMVKLDGDIAAALRIYEVLEKLKIKFTPDDANQRWRIFRAPKDIETALGQAQDSWTLTEKGFSKEMAEEMELFLETLNDIEDTILTFFRFTDLSKCNEIFGNAQSVSDRLKDASTAAKVFNQREVLLGNEPTDYSRVGAMTKEWEPYSTFWRIAHDWVNDEPKWRHGRFDKIDAKDMENKIGTGGKQLHKVLRQLGTTPENATLIEVATEVKQQLEDFQPYVPIVTALRNPGMRERHWQAVGQLLAGEGQEPLKVGPDFAEVKSGGTSTFTLDSLIGLGMLDVAEKVAEVGERSAKEFSIENQLRAMQKAWETVEFDCRETYRSTGTYILKGSEEASMLLDEHIVVTQAMQFSLYNKPFKQEIDEWAAKLLYVSECLEAWLKVQRAWMYLQPIFDSPDLMVQLPNEGKKFKSVDNTWRQVMGRVSKDNKVIHACSQDGLLDKWVQAIKDLDWVQKGLEDYLEVKRAAFARFYFLSNDELLEILSQTKDPTRVQPFLCKVFENMSSLTFNEDLTVSSMSSLEGENIPFVELLSTSGKNVEQWMTEVEEAMREAVRAALYNAVLKYVEVPRTEWCVINPAQTVLNGSQIHWTSEVEAHINEGTVSLYAEQLHQQLMDLVTLIRGGISKLQRTTVGALVVIDVHAKDVVEKLHNENITNTSAFEWISQLRYYWNKDDTGRENCWVMMVQTDFPYGYEYLGNTFRLVITPLTDMCYMTLMGAQSLNLGGAPAGPAGTGKTETTKDLAKALAKQCVVFNCSPEMDYIMVGKFFKGLACSGAWCCFDEFNRIYIEVLSVIAQQLLVLFGAKAELASYSESKELDFEGSTISMRPTFNVFITMNPGYAGRTELPDNLQALFRPMAMMVPDYALIGEIMFYAYGFASGRALAQKMVSTFKLSSEQLSSQDHYDYGMRAVKSTIEAAGLLKRLHPDQDENQILLRALNDVNVPKFLKDDLPLFANIITDLFPDTDPPVVEYGELKPALVTALEHAAMQSTDYVMLKCIQLYDTLQVRHGMMLVGPTGGGKTNTYKALQAAMSSLADEEEPEAPYQKVHTHIINPKAITQAQLYGAFDEITHEWSDGIAAEELRIAVRDTSPDKHWIIFDGPVDALWIESMNTVLDDNKKLCLVSGEIITLTAQVRMMFEVSDLAVASPATVSRCGMVYVEPESLGMNPLIDSWLSGLPESFAQFAPKYKDRLSAYCHDYIQNCVMFAKKRLREIVFVMENSLCASCLRLLNCEFARLRPNEYVKLESLKEPVKELDQALGSVFIFALLWSVGAAIDGPGRERLSSFLWATLSDDPGKLLDEHDRGGEGAGFRLPPSHSNDIKLNGVDEGDNLFDYCFLVAENRWVPWLETIPEFVVPRNAKYEDIVVPTIDSIRSTHLLRTLSEHHHHTLSCGPTGTGKSVNTSQYLLKAAPDNFQPVFVNFSAQTHVNQFQDLVDSKVEKRRRGVFGPPAGKKMVLFVDDLNMPQKEFYGAQPPIELLRMWLDHGGWYNRKELVFNQVVDMIVVGAMGLPGGGRTFITERLKRHYHLIGYIDLKERSISGIFNTVAGYFFKPFDEEVQTLVPKMVSGIIDIFHKIGDTLLPTPAKSHYTFNLRDIWKVFLGICGLSKQKGNTAMMATRCWVHEINRVFGDRLVDNKDRSWLEEQEKEKLREYFGVDPEEVLNADRLVFGRFMDVGADVQHYVEISDMERMKQVIEAYLEEYNSTATHRMPLVMFLDACEHVSRISRILDQPRANALLLGVGGSGRQSLTRLSSFICDYECYQIEVAKGYGMNEFKEDVKTCLMKCGVEDKVQVFLFCDTQIISEQMVEAINNVLNSGDVPNLYKAEDLDVIASGCRTVCQQQGLQPTKANIFAAYLSRVQKNVHVVLAFSPVGDAFRTRLRMFPSLVNCCTIDWFAEWPAEALYSVAQQEIVGGGVQLPNVEGVLNGFKFVHQSVESEAKKFFEVLKRKVYVTPTSFLELLGSFKTILAEKRKEVGLLQHRYQVGLDKISGAEEQVAKLQDDLVAMKPVLEQTSKEVAEMMVVIEADKKDAAVTQEAVAKEESEAFTKKEITQTIKDDAQRDLDEAIPALEEAVRCLSKLKAEHVREVKAMTNPPSGVKLTMEAVCIMFSIKPVRKNDPNKLGAKIDDYWESAQKELLQDPKKLLDSLMHYDKENIPDAVIEKITPYIEREDFDPQAIKKASVACEAICMWARAMFKYNTVSKAVEPKRVKLREAEEELKVTMERLDEAQEKLAQVNARIAKLEADYSAAVEKQQQLQHDSHMCEVKLERAHKLIGGLGGEKSRWRDNVKNLTRSLDLLPGDCLVAASGVSYLGPFTNEYRLECEASWRQEMSAREVEYTENCSLRSALGEPVKIEQWVVCGLPNDSLSIGNGIILDKARRWPLMIDPQRQANKFIKTMGNSIDNGMDICKLSDANLLRTMELAIQFGKWVILENIGEELDPALEPILLQQKSKDGSGYIIRLGDKNVPYNDTFRLFMTTTLPNPHYSPENSVKVTLLNFAITPEGLEDQMLGIVVSKERPELEAQKSQLVQQNAKMNAQLKGIEDEILRLLATSEGDVLEDDTLINAIAQSKATATEIQEKQAEAAVTEKNIDEARESYRCVAYRSSLIFFCIVGLTNIDPMYQYSLRWFQQLFSLGIDQAPKPANALDLGSRLESLIDYNTYIFYQNVCRGLFEKDKLMFSFALCIKLMQGDNRVPPNELRFLLTGPTEDLVESGPPIPADWISRPSWNEILGLEAHVPECTGLSKNITENPGEFRKIYDTTDAHSMALPDPWETSLSPLQKLCFLRTLRLDEVIPGVVSFVAKELGQRFVEPPTFDIAKSFADSTNMNPLIFILSSGSDPTSEVLAFAESMHMSKKMEAISLGQGQGPKAAKMIHHASGNGGWVLLQNCHLAASWMSTLEKICEHLSPETTDSNYRLWLTSMPSKAFPVMVLQSGVKMTNEPPKGLRANLLRSYAQMNDNIWEDSSKPEVFRKLLFGFCFFHAVVQDRRKFGPIGWNIPYGFTNEDLAVCRRQLMVFINQYDEVPYKVLNYLGAQINYGGRVTDDKDKRLINCILTTYCCESLVTNGSEYRFSESGTYYCPEQAVYMDDFMKYILTLPLNPSPEAFGMHENCNITCAQTEAETLLAGMIEMAPSGAGEGGGKTVEEMIDETAAQIQDKTPTLIDFDLVDERYPTKYEESLNTVLKQEVLRYNRLIEIMQSSLKELRKALKGLVAMSAELEVASHQLFANTVPDMWAELGFLSMKPLSSWINDLVDRIAFLNQWIENGTPKAFWMSGLLNRLYVLPISGAVFHFRFFPQAFLTGCLQNYARKFTLEIDRLQFGFNCLDISKPDQVSEPPAHGAYVFGLFLEGCRWDPQQRLLSESLPKELSRRTADSPPAPNRASAKFIWLPPGLGGAGYLELPSDRPQDVWIRAGVAAFLSLKF
ncbi:Dynein heavy chain 1, axonemal [Perkinsus chesapeaki]|uniref:Dynein heavy chain 1, axonemal n=1 Tax=Perkinsus chesapeaki TaxID=330153 RepID=A0A7J6MNA8_PERCH|nr:Dynein heavy chain 1, axonemal [Perkinsus chesapeaki]